jgi:hypothetical protein
VREAVGLAITEAQAIQAVREHVAPDRDAGARAWRVDRLDRPGQAYYLVVIERGGAADAIAAVDAADGRVLTSARLPGAGLPVALDPGEAVRRAGLGGGAATRLVWAPSRASRSMLDPIWQVAAGGRAVYVDQRGGVWERLEPAGPGGAG